MSSYSVLTGDAWDQFEGSEHSHRPQGPQVHRNVHVCACCSQNPAEVNTNECLHAIPHRRKAESGIVPVLQMHMNATIVTLCTLWQKGDSHAHKHTEAVTHSVGGWLRRSDMEHEDERVSSRQRKQRKQQGCFGDFWLFPSLCVGGRMWQRLFRRRTKQAAPSGDGRILLSWRTMELMKEHTHKPNKSTSYLLLQKSITLYWFFWSLPFQIHLCSGQPSCLASCFLIISHCVALHPQTSHLSSPSSL